MSYESLSPEAALLYRRLGEHPGSTIDVRLAPALLGSADAGAALAELTAAALVSVEDRDGTTRCVVAPQIQAHARSLAAADDGDVRTASVQRALEWYLGALISTARLLNPLSPRYGPDPVGHVSFTARATAARWFEAEETALLTLLQWPVDDELTWRVVEASWVAAQKGSHNEWLVEAHRLGADAARRNGRLDVQSIMCTRQSWGLRLRNDHHGACACADLAIELAVAAGDWWANMAALSAAGRAWLARGTPVHAGSLHQRARALAERHGHRRGVALQDQHRADCAVAGGRLIAASQLYADSAEGLRALGDEDGWASSRGALAAVTVELGDPDTARAQLIEPLRIMAASGSRVSLADLLTTAARADTALGELDTARAQLIAAGDLYAAAGQTSRADAMRTAAAEI